jgi:phage shock protein PspC (stress-responsive transcriptional regulator)
MRTVITISLNGNSYQLEAAGYEALRGYLQGAEQRLADNPDQAEILADLEQAIADKCGRFLSPHKNVVSAEEVGQVIREMGPVDGAAGDEGATAGPTTSKQLPPADQAGATTQPGGAPKRLYQIREGAMISGVCKGLAAYLDIDVSILRSIFVVLAILTGGAWILVYIVMAFVIPYAQTSEQHAAAHGWPFNAEELIGRAKGHYSEFKDGKHWRQRYREQRRMWKYQRKQWRHQGRAWQRWGGPNHVPPPPPPFADVRPVNASYTTQVLGGVLTPIAALLSAVLFLVFLFALVSLVTRHSILGWTLPADIPLWLGIVVLAVLYRVIVSPLHEARHAAYYGGPYSHGWLALWGAMLWLGLVALFAWLAWHHWPQVQYFFQQLDAVIHGVLDHHSASTPATV